MGHVDVGRRITLLGPLFVSAQGREDPVGQAPAQGPKRLGPGLSPAQQRVHVGLGACLRRSDVDGVTAVMAASWQDRHGANTALLGAYLATPIRHVFADQGFAGRLVD